MAAEAYDCIIIGAGPGGLPADHAELLTEDGIAFLAGLALEREGDGAN